MTTAAVDKDAKKDQENTILRCGAAAFDPKDNQRVELAPAQSKRLSEKCRLRPNGLKRKDPQCSPQVANR